MFFSYRNSYCVLFCYKVDVFGYYYFGSGNGFESIDLNFCFVFFGISDRKLINVRGNVCYYGI